MADFNKPSGGSIWSTLLGEIRSARESVAKLFEGGAGDSNVPVGAKRMDADGSVYRWNGSAWSSVAQIGVDSTARADASAANSAAGTALTAANSAQATADTLAASIAQDPENMPLRYVAPTQQGNGSGDSAANAIAASTVSTEIAANPAIVLMFTAGAYGNIFGSTAYVGKTIYLINVGVATFTQGIACESSDIILGIAPGGSVPDFGSGSFAATYGSALRTVNNGTVVIDGLAIVESGLICGGTLYVDVNSVAQFPSISCGNVSALAGSYVRHSLGSQMEVAGNLVCEERSHIRSGGTMNIVGTAVVRYDSFVRTQSGFPGTTPTASNGGANYVP